MTDQNYTIQTITPPSVPTFAVFKDVKDGDEFSQRVQVWAQIRTPDGVVTVEGLIVSIAEGDPSLVPASRAFDPADVVFQTYTGAAGAGEAEDE